LTYASSFGLLFFNLYAIFITANATLISGEDDDGGGVVAKTMMAVAMMHEMHLYMVGYMASLASPTSTLFKPSTFC
jgi:hypothetical protein